MRPTLEELPDLPTVTLDDDDCEPGALPMVCMACGRPAEVERAKSFAWRPAEVYLYWPIAGLSWSPIACACGGILNVKGVVSVGTAIIVSVVATLFACALMPLLYTKRRLVRTPLCPDHAAYWIVRSALRNGGALALFGSIAGTVAFAPAASWKGAALSAQVAAGAMWMIALNVVGAYSIRPSRIDAERITLDGVHADFATALDRQRAAPPAGG